MVTDYKSHWLPLILLLYKIISIFLHIDYLLVISALEAEPFPAEPCTFSTASARTCTIYPWQGCALRLSRRPISTQSSIIKPQIPTTSNSTHTIFGPTPAHIRAHALPSSNPRSYCRDASPCKPLRASAASLPNLVILLQRRPQFKNGGFVLKILTSLA